MTIENDAFFHFLIANHFHQHIPVYGNKENKYYFSPDNGHYDPATSYRIYLWNNICFKFDGVICYLHFKQTLITRFFVSTSIPFQGDDYIYFDIPFEVVNFVLTKHLQTNIDKVGFKNVSIKPSRYISPDIRRQVLADYNYTCNACPNTNRLEIDHIYPVSKGGTSEIKNLQVLCRSCNAKKHAKLPD